MKQRSARCGQTTKRFCGDTHTSKNKRRVRPSPGQRELSQFEIQLYFGEKSANKFNLIYASTFAITIRTQQKNRQSIFGFKHSNRVMALCVITVDACTLEVHKHASTYLTCDKHIKSYRCPRSVCIVWRKVLGRI